MDVEEILEKHSLTRENAAKYIDAITRMNQSETADELQVSRDTISRYKRAFEEMTPEERLLLIASLMQEKFLQNVAES